MTTIKLILLILLLHLFADYTLQGCLANLKTKDWWLDLFKKGSTWISYEGLVRKYGNDYRAGLLCHSLYWTLVTFAPLIYISESDWFIAAMVGLNTVVHYVVDDLKANAHTINLIQDQLIHLVQIAATVGAWKFF